MADTEPPWGARLREWRENTKRWSQQELVDRIIQLAYRTNAERGTNLTVALLQKWENGTVRRPHYSYQRLLGELGAPVPSVKTADSQPGGDTNRDRAPGLAAHQHGDAPRTTALVHTLTGARDAASDPPTIAAIRAVSDSFQFADRRLGGGKLYHAVLRYLRSEISPSLLDPPDDCTSTDLFSAAASLTEIAGWMAHDGGNNSRARQHLSQAYRLAVAGENAALSANVCASMAHLAIQLDLPDDVERISAAGLNHIVRFEGSRHLVARLRAMQARGYAMRGLEYECKTALEEAHESLASGKADDVTIGWIAGFDDASLASESALCYLALGVLISAESESRKVIHLRDGDRVRSRALSQLTLANVMLRRRDYNEAARLGLEICAVAPALNSVRVHTGLSSLGRALGNFSGTPDVAAFLVAQVEACREQIDLDQEDRWPV
jgi:hypothetical protein